MDIILIGVIVIVIIIICIIVYYYMGVDEWTFIPYMDSPGHSIIQVKNFTLEDMKKFAEKDPSIVAFNTNGWMKTAVAPKSAWNRWTDDANKGMWIKKDYLSK